MKKTKGVSLFFVLMLFVGFVLPALTMAQEKVIELKYATPFAAQYPYSQGDLQFFQKIEKETNGRVKIKPYWSGTLMSASEAMLELSKGVADMAYVSPGYSKAGVDLIKALPGFMLAPLDAVGKLKVFWGTYEKIPEFRKEFASIKILSLEAAGREASIRIMLLKPIKTLNDLRGVRLKCNPSQVGPLAALGAEGVVIPMQDTYESLQKGIIGGVLAPHSTYKGDKFAELIKYEIGNVVIGRGIPGVGRFMNWNTWNKLPPDIQKYFDANGEWWALASSQANDKAESEGLELAKKAGVKFIQLPEEDVQKFYASFQAQQIKEAKDLDARGFPGTKMYEEIQRLQKLYSVKQ